MVPESNRPLSPHLQVYKLPLTGLVSITHRITGVLLSAGLIFVVYLISALAGGHDAYAKMQSIAGMGWVRFVYWGFIYALYFHLCHGVRHLIWDAGKSFEAETLKTYALIELGVSFLLMLVTFLLAG